MSWPISSDRCSEVSLVVTRLTDAGLQIPEVVPPVAAYQPAVRVGEWVYTAGQLPMSDGSLLATGRLGDEVNETLGRQCAQQCALNAIAAIGSVVDDLDRVRIVKVTGFVASAPQFTGQPGVVNGASDLFGLAFGQAGVHARSAIGTASLPLGAPVEVEVVAHIGGQETG